MKPTILEVIRQMRESVGSDVTDLELTDLIRARGELVEHGFQFLRLHQGFVLFSVPYQDCAAWHGVTTWVAPAKEQTARTIAGKYHLGIYEPPDVTNLATRCEHHFDFASALGSVVIAHRQYLKVRLTRKPLENEPEVLHDLASLYPCAD